MLRQQYMLVKKFFLVALVSKYLCEKQDNSIQIPKLKDSSFEYKIIKKRRSVRGGLALLKRSRSHRNVIQFFSFISTPSRNLEKTTRISSINANFSDIVQKKGKPKISARIYLHATKPKYKKFNKPIRRAERRLKICM